VMAKRALAALGRRAVLRVLRGVFGSIGFGCRHGISQSAESCKRDAMALLR